jgi:kynurenine formamidase
MKNLFTFIPTLNTFHQTHTLDSHSGTHLVPPAYALPARGFDNRKYATEVQEWLAAYEKKYGPRGTSNVTTEKVPVGETCGRARVIDVKHLVGTTTKDRWPASPEITPADIEKYETREARLRPGDIVIFQSGYSDKYFKPFPQGTACLADPLNGKSEGWPAPGPDAIMALAKKGIRCVATDGPTLGGAEPRRALTTYWALGSKGMVGVEYLTNVGKLPEKAYFIFVAVKIRGCHGGPGRAIGVY